jgi:uncharacterized membrane protein YecN with MAPEG domain
MKPKSLKLLLLRGLFFLIIGLMLWIYLQPSYSKLLASVSQKLHSWFLVDGKEKTWIRVQGNMILYIPQGLISSEKKNIPVGMKDVRSIHYNSVILFALILFSPGLGIRKRTWVLVAGMVLLFLTQVITVLVQAKFSYVFQLGEYGGIHYGAWERNVSAFLKQFFELIGRFSFPFAIWMLFTYRETVEYLTGTEEVKPHKRRKRR